MALPGYALLLHATLKCCLLHPAAICSACCSLLHPAAIAPLHPALEVALGLLTARVGIPLVVFEALEVVLLHLVRARSAPKGGWQWGLGGLRAPARTRTVRAYAWAACLFWRVFPACGARGTAPRDCPPCRKQMLSRNPVQMYLRALPKVVQREHPLLGGLGRLVPAATESYCVSHDACCAEWGPLLRVLLGEGVSWTAGLLRWAGRL